MSHTSYEPRRQQYVIGRQQHTIEHEIFEGLMGKYG